MAALEQRPSNEWGVVEAFKTLETVTAGSSAAIGAMSFLRTHIERLSRPAHEREPPHCSTCSCGLATEPLSDPVLAEIQARMSAWPMQAQADINGLLMHVCELRLKLDRLRTALRGVQSCSTCAACRGAATLALEGTAP